MMSLHYYCFVIIFVMVLLQFLIVTSSKITSVKERMIGLSLRAAVYNYPPIMEAIKRGKNVTYEGPAMEFMDMLARHFQITLILDQVDESEIKRVGFNEALWSLVVKRKVDFVSYPFQRVAEYAKDSDFSYPIWILPFTFLQPWPKEANTRLSAPVKPFTFTVWLLFIVSTVTLTIVMGIAWFFSKNLRQHDRERQNESSSSAGVGWHINQSADYVIAIIFNQGGRVAYASCSSVYILVGIWLLSLIVLVNAYTGTLTAFLTVPKLKPIINSIEELAASDELALAVEPNTDFYNKFVNASHGPYKIIGDSLRANPDHLLLDVSFTNIVSKILSHGCVYPTPVAMAEYLIRVDYKLKGQCRMTPASKSLNYFASLGMPMAKGAFYNDAISENFIRRLWEGGIVDIWLKMYFSPIPQCHAGEIMTRHQLSVIKLIDFQAVFLLLAIGVVISSLVFGMEQVFGSCFCYFRDLV